MREDARLCGATWVSCTASKRVIDGDVTARSVLYKELFLFQSTLFYTLQGQERRCKTVKVSAANKH